jgi:hypothetical protein
MSTPAVNSALHTYLNNHLSGSSTGIQLIEHLIASAPDDQERAFFQQLHTEITADQQVLEDVLSQSGDEPGTLRKAGGALMEWLGRLKLTLDDVTHQRVARLEALEVLSLGILGKRALWRALAIAGNPALRGHDFSSLERRAEDQHQRVEARRLEAARRVLGGAA